MTELTCKHCDGPGGKRTLANQVSMPINGRVQCIDHCIHRIVAALNAAGVTTTASCCGHGQMPGNIMLEDGRVLVIADNLEQVVWRSEAVKADAMPASDLHAALKAVGE